jgi:hypothetical protein
MKLLITVTLLSIVGFLFAQNGTSNKKIPVTVFKDDKAVGVKFVSPNADSTIIKDSPKIDTITIAKDYPVYSSNMTFLEKCKYFILSFKRQNSFMFWSLVVIIGFWLLRFLFKLFDR